jgi:pimeloyl-ACP methyl ester carboxylesterase
MSISFTGKGARACRLVLMACAALALPLAGVARQPAEQTTGSTSSLGLFVDCRGRATSSPTVILESGAFGTSADWDLVMDDLAKDGRVCAYDRSGLGRSPPGGAGLDVLSRARELASLLDQLRETRPVILVGHSNGALYVEAFAKLWPQRVAGLVYVNGVGSDDLDHPLLMDQLAQERQLSNLAVTVGHMGLSGLVAAKLGDDEGLSGDAAARKRASLTCLPCLEVARDEDVLIAPGLKDVRDLPADVSHIPTVVIVGDPEPADWRLPRTWREAEEAPAKRADHAWVLEAQGASHVSPLARDRAYVDAAVAWLRAPYAASGNVGVTSSPGSP